MCAESLFSMSDFPELTIDETKGKIKGKGRY